MLVAKIKIWKSHLNIREGSDYPTTNLGHTVQKIKQQCHRCFFNIHGFSQTATTYRESLQGTVDAFLR